MIYSIHMIASIFELFKFTHSTSLAFEAIKRVPLTFLPHKYVPGGRAPAMDDRLNGHMAEMGGGPAANDGSQLFHHGGAAMAAVSGIFSSADMASGPSGQDDWERGAGSAVSAPVN